MKLYAVLSQAHFVKQQAADWEGAFLGILALGFPLFLKHTADVVIHPDRGYSNMVSTLALLLPLQLLCIFADVFVYSNRGYSNMGSCLALFCSALPAWQQYTASTLLMWSLTLPKATAIWPVALSRCVPQHPVGIVVPASALLVWSSTLMEAAALC